MEEKNMTALVSCFARAYHYKNNEYRIFSDPYAEKILSKKDYQNIALNMSNGIKFFNPNFVGNEEEALKWIVDNQLSPSILARSIFTEKALMSATKIGCRQYLIYASGYDTFAYRNNIEGLSVFEIDRKEMIDDKKKRLLHNIIDSSKINYIECDFTELDWINSKYNKEIISFNSLLGISYYLTKEEFKNMIINISKIISNGSTLVFDYPTYTLDEKCQKNEILAEAANEQMKSKYSYRDIEKILSDNGFLIYEHLSNKEINDNYFEKYNLLNPNHKIYAPIGVNYCLAVKKDVI